MKEDFLHYVWQYQKISTSQIKTVSGSTVQVKSVGQYNLNSGPDFFNARIRIQNQEWAGNIEIHIKSSDWYHHNHENDSNYDNIILHVVWEYDVEVFDKLNNAIETVELRGIVNEKLQEKYKDLMYNRNWINCEKSLSQIDSFTIEMLKEQQLINRLERKSLEIQNMLKQLNNDWEEVLYKLLLRYFGVKLNTDRFSEIGANIPFKIFNKEKSKLENLEALIFGSTKLLEKPQDFYAKELQENYKYLKRKYKLKDLSVNLEFFRLRPLNFPTIRLSQFCNLYHKEPRLFRVIIKENSLHTLYKIFETETSNYWKTHYTFNKESKKHRKALSKSFIDLIIINVVLPLRFVYQELDSTIQIDDILDMYNAIGAEKNSMTDKFRDLGFSVNSALDSQSLIELKTTQCDLNKCMNCSIANKLLN